MRQSLSSRKLFLVALLAPVVALLAVFAVTALNPPAIPKVVVNVWPQTAEVIEAVHLESIAAAKRHAADGDASQQAQAERRAKTDAVLAEWSATGVDPSQIRSLLDRARGTAADVVADDATNQPAPSAAEGSGITDESDRLLEFADVVRARASAASGDENGVASLLLAARYDAAVGVEGAELANAKTAPRAQRTRIAGMADIVDQSFANVGFETPSNLAALLDQTGELRTRLLNGDVVTLNEWTDGYAQRQLAVGEVAYAQAVASTGPAPEPSAFPDRLVMLIAGLGIVAALALGALVFGRASRELDSLSSSLSSYAEISVPALFTSAKAAAAVPELTPEVTSATAPVGQAFADVQKAVSSAHQQQRADHEQVTSGIFSSIAQRLQLSTDAQRALIDSMGRDEPNTARREELHQLASHTARLERDVAGLNALSAVSTGQRSDHSPAGADKSAKDILDHVIEAAAGADRVRVAQVDDVMIAGAIARDIEHLLSELLENALLSSPPEAMVEIGCQLSAQGSLVLMVEDSGAAMPVEEMVRLNTLLSSAPEISVATVPALGSVALATLAQRSGADVVFADGAVSGVATHVTVPADAVFERLAFDSSEHDVAHLAEIAERAVDEETVAPDDHLEAQEIEGEAIEAGKPRSDDSAPDTNETTLVASEPDTLDTQEPGPASFDRTLPAAEFTYDTGSDDIDTEEIASADLDMDPFATDLVGAEYEIHEPAVATFDAGDPSSEDPPSEDPANEDPANEDPANEDPAIDDIVASTDTPSEPFDFDANPFAHDDVASYDTIEDTTEPKVAVDDPWEHSPFTAPADTVEQSALEPVEEPDDEPAEEPVEDTTDDLDAFDTFEQEVFVPFVRDKPAPLVALAEPPSGHDSAESIDTSTFSDVAGSSHAAEATDEAATPHTGGPVEKRHDRPRRPSGKASRYAALDSLLEKLPERVEDAPEPGSALTQRVPGGHCRVLPRDVSPTGLRTANRPAKTPDEVREMVAKYRLGSTPK